MYLDGVLQKTIDLASSTAVYQQDVWSTHGLPSGVHKVKFVRSSSSASGKYLVIDAVDVLGSVIDTTTRYEQDDSRLIYSGTWSQQTVPQASGGSSRRLRERSASVIVTFTGTRLDWIAMLAPENGKADVSLDGGELQTIDLHSDTTLYQQMVWTTGTLTRATHWVEMMQYGVGRIRKAYVEGDLEWGSLAFSQVCGLIQEIPSCQELIESIVSGAEEIMKCMGQKVQPS